MFYFMGKLGLIVVAAWSSVWLEGFWGCLWTHWEIETLSTSNVCPGMGRSSRTWDPSEAERVRRELLLTHVGMELQGHMVTVCFKIWGTANCFPKLLHYFTSLPAMNDGSNFTSSPTLLISPGGSKEAAVTSQRGDTWRMSEIRTYIHIAMGERNFISQILAYKIFKLFTLSAQILSIWTVLIVLSKIEIASFLFIFLFLLFPYIKTWYFGPSNAFLDVLASLVIHSLNKSV